jgi:Domain of unknown function (DUF1707)
MTGEVSPLGRGDDMAPSGELRASHEDRDRVVELLRVAAGDGRLTAEELDERLEKALKARTYGELAELSRDLPAASSFVPGPAAPKPKDVLRIYRTSGWAKREGRWLVPPRIEVRVRSGHIKLDFTEAVITRPLLRIDAEVGSGGLKLLTRPGIVVDTDEVTARSGKVKVREPWGPEVPVILRIEVSGKVGSGRLKVRPPRRNFGQWLLRRPRPYALSSP